MELENKLARERESKLRSMVGSGSSFSIENIHEKDLDALLSTRMIVSTRCCAMKARTAFKLLQEDYHSKRLSLTESQTVDTPHSKDWLFEEEAIRKRKLAEKLTKSGKTPPATNSPITAERKREKAEMLEKSLSALDAEYVLAVQTLCDELAAEKKIKDTEEDSIREKWFRNPTDINTETEIKNLQEEFNVEVKENKMKLEVFATKCKENCEREKQLKKNEMDFIEMKKLNERSPLSNFLKTNLPEEKNMEIDLDNKEITEILFKEINSLDEACKQMLTNDSRILNAEISDILIIISSALTWATKIDYRALQSLLHQKILERTYCEGGMYFLPSDSDLININLLSNPIFFT